MKVSDLVRLLENCDQDAPVVRLSGEHFDPEAISEVRLVFVDELAPFSYSPARDSNHTIPAVLLS